MPINRPLNIGVVCGEHSGDRLGAGLIKEIKKNSDVNLFGVGGPKLEELGVNSEFNFFKIVKDFVNKAQFQGGSKVTIDGLRVDFDDGWGLIRASNTTPKLVLRFEAKTSSRLKEIKNIFLNQLKLIDETIQIDIS